MEFESILLDERISLPKYASNGAAAIDLQAVRIFDDKNNVLAIEEKLVIKPGCLVKVGSGIKIHIMDANIASIIIPRSGKGSDGLVIGNLVGLIDSDYTGELIMSLWNRTFDREFVIEPLERVAQLVFIPVIRPKLKMVENFSVNSLRGEGGFGSTGK